MAKITRERIEAQCAHYGGLVGSERCLIAERNWADGVVPERCKLCPDRPAKWHAGRMITRERAEAVARDLFGNLRPDSYLVATECSCHDCTATREARKIRWAATVTTVRRAMLTGFGHDYVEIEAIEAKEGI